MIREEANLKTRTCSIFSLSLSLSLCRYVNLRHYVCDETDSNLLSLFCYSMTLDATMFCERLYFDKVGNLDT